MKTYEELMNEANISSNRNKQAIKTFKQITAFLDKAVDKIVVAKTGLLKGVIAKSEKEIVIAQLSQLTEINEIIYAVKYTLSSMESHNVKVRPDIKRIPKDVEKQFDEIRRKVYK